MVGGIIFFVIIVRFLGILLIGFLSCILSWEVCIIEMFFKIWDRGIKGIFFYKLVISIFMD